MYSLCPSFTSLFYQNPVPFVLTLLPRQLLHNFKVHHYHHRAEFRVHLIAASALVYSTFFYFSAKFLFSYIMGKLGGNRRHRLYGAVAAAKRYCGDRRYLKPVVRGLPGNQAPVPGLLQALNLESRPERSAQVH
jgi:hypothetical protein